MPDVMKTVGRYEILREVGRGGMAMVYLARQTDLDRFVALKELGAFHASDPSFAQRFLRESRVAGSLSHPNVVTVHDYFEHDGTPYIAMEYIERGSLRPFVGRMTLAQIGGVLEGLLAGLVHGESHGIVHRDLKPENLMVTSDGRVKIADFGIAKATTKMQTGAFLTATGTTVGTPTYMAPEQAMAQDIGPWTDLYSVGCMAFELFTGNVPFHDSDAPMAILLRHVNEPIAPVKSIRPEVDQRISDWIERLLVKEPTQRTQSANDAWDEFEEILLNLLGPRWRREARLVERAPEQTENAAKPLTPAPFPTDDVASEEFKSFAWGAPASDTGPAAAPPMYTPPPDENTPAIPEPVVGPPTPMPSQAVPAPPAASSEPIDEPEFLTFGAPAPAIPTDALIAPAQPVQEPTVQTPPPVEAAAPAPPEAAPAGFDSGSGFAAPSDLVETPAEEPKSFETYVAPPPSRPPTSEPPLTPPPVEAAPPPASTPTPAPVAYRSEPEVAATMMPQTVTPPPETPAPPAKQDEGGGSSGKKVVFGLIAAGVLLLVVVGIVLAMSGSGGGDDPTEPVASVAPQNDNETPAEPPAADLTPVTAGAIALEVPSDWTDSGDLPQVPGMAGGAVTKADPDGGGIVVGTADKSAANSTLLSDDMRDAIGSVPEKQVADLGGGVQAARYDGVQLGGKSATIFAIPTSEGVATLTCTTEPASCETVANTLKINDGTTFPVGPSEAYQGDVEAALTKLEKAEKSAASALKKAKTRSGQVSATSKLAGAYTTAATKLRKLEVSPADTLLNRQLAASLKDAGAAYKKAASEGKGKDAAGYKREGKKAVAAGRDLDKALDGLASAGYTLPAGLVKNASSVTKLPALKKDPVKKTTTTTTTTTPSTPSTPSTPQSGQSGQSGQASQPRTPVQPVQPITKPKPKSGGGDTGLSGGGEG